MNAVVSAEGIPFVIHCSPFAVRSYRQNIVDVKALEAIVQQGR